VRSVAIPVTMAPCPWLPGGSAHHPRPLLQPVSSPLSRRELATLLADRIAATHAVDALVCDAGVANIAGEMVFASRPGPYP
jgi:hypothetical protein